MLLASGALLAVVAAGTLVLLAARSLARAEADLHAARRRELAYRAFTSERRRLLEARIALADATTSTVGAAQLGTEITQAGHQAVAQLPFGLFAAASRSLRRLRGWQVTPPVEDGSDPPEPPTPPARPPG